MPLGGRSKPTTVLQSNVWKSERLGVRAAVTLIRGYQLFIRPLLNGSCRYLPTCSEYAVEAILTRGVVRGTWMGLKRVLRCHPFGGSGLDPVR
jgi:putative membrane protein insertion efficiency factor